MSLGQALFDELPGLVDIRARLENHHDRGEAGQRF
jgi:hypothetical protein